MSLFQSRVYTRLNGQKVSKLLSLQFHTACNNIWPSKSKCEVGHVKYHKVQSLSKKYDLNAYIFEQRNILTSKIPLKVSITSVVSVSSFILSSLIGAHSFPMIPMTN